LPARDLCTGIRLTMNWSEILRQAGIPESPGRQQAANAALDRAAARRAAAAQPKQPKQPKPPGRKS
jgi:hypothetical protein